MEALIERLKIKPIPKKKEDNVIQLNNDTTKTSDELEEVDVSALLEDNPDFFIYDKTKETNDFDEKVFLNEINDMKNIRQNIPKIIQEQEDKIKEENIGEIIPVKRNKRKPKIDTSKSAITEIASIDIGEEIKQKLPQPKDIVLIKKPSYYMNNREIFTKFINSLFADYRKETINSNLTVECDKKTKNVVTKRKDGSTLSSNNFSLLTHQKIILDYLNIYTPYRGLLIYHGLGSGKTCSSIAVAESHIHAASSIAFTEGIVQSKKVIVMTPASLRVNYFEELKKCGNPIYKKKQFWEFVKLSENNSKEMLSSILHLPIKYIETSGGAWMVDINKSSNYESLSPTQKLSLDEQLNEMIHNKYQFINYNGIQKKHVNQLTKNNTVNPFDNKVVIIDEAHNFISGIVNKIKFGKKYTEYKYTVLYHNLMKANNAKIILLSGTPIINYPNEIAILYNILRGFIKTFHIPISTSTKKYTEEQFKKLFQKHQIIDYLEYKSGMLKITRTPFGFVNKFYGLSYKGTRYINKEELSDNAFVSNIIEILNTNKIKFNSDNIKVVNTKALPDKLDDFNEMFFDPSTGDMKNTNLFKRRILGLTSYFKSASEDLMPRYDYLKDTHIEKINMSNYQFEKYQEVRLLERANEEKNKKRKQFQRSMALQHEEEESLTTYRIFSRAFCNFVFPDPPGRPMPSETLEESINNTKDEDNMDALTLEERSKNIDNRITEEDNEDISYNVESYSVRIQNALNTLEENKVKYLTGENLEKYSPKFAAILNNMDTLDGLHLLYSQFRTIEGIKVFSMVLEANGYTQFKIKKNSSSQWILDVPQDKFETSKMFVLYTGTETAEEKEVIRHIYNGTWEYLPLSLIEELNKIHPNNINGEIIKIFMITQSGAEGISLANTKYIHIMEPYWHPVRTEQVIGRARRICSHVDLPEQERFIKVFYYLMQFTNQQIEEKMNTDIQTNDISKLDRSNLRPLTSDETLSETSKKKENITKQILKNIKEAAIDCSIHTTSSSGEVLECYSFGNDVDANVFSYKPNYENDSKDGKQIKRNVEQEQWRAKRKNINGTYYAVRLDRNNKETNMVYDLDQYVQAQNNPQIKINLVGKIIEKDGKQFIDTNI